MNPTGEELSERLPDRGRNRARPVADGGLVRSLDHDACQGLRARIANQDPPRPRQRRLGGANLRLDTRKAPEILLSSDRHTLQYLGERSEEHTSELQSP